MESKTWNVTYTEDMVTFKTDTIEGKTYTDAYVNMMVKHPKAMITDLKEC